MASEFTHAMRQIELQLALKLLPQAGNLLELGAGDGWQARQLQERGYEVRAVDVETHAKGAGRYFQVTPYDGVKLPFADQSFDAVYSSNVLEHVVAFDQVQQELARVLRPGGVAVHCVPSAVWRFWTTIGHPLHALKTAYRMVLAGRDIDNAPRQEHRIAMGRMGPLALIRTALLSPRHGEHGNLLSEHWLFSRRRWEERFRAGGWHIVSITPCNIFYTGNELLGLHLKAAARQRAASFLGSSTLFFVLKPPHPTDTDL